jgi:phosphoglycolate phosphatase
LESVVRGRVVFDLDGTLIDSVPLCTRIINEMLAVRGAVRRVSEAETKPYVTTGGRRMLAALLADRCGDIGSELAEFRRRYAETPTDRDHLFPGAREALVALRRAGLELSVWSNKPQELCEKVITELGLAPLFRTVVGSGPNVPLKPDLTGLDVALGDTPRTRCCSVGDSEPDWQVARAAGLRLVLMTFGYGDYARGWPGAALCDSFHDLPGLVELMLPAGDAA